MQSGFGIGRGLPEAAATGAGQGNGKAPMLASLTEIGSASGKPNRESRPPGLGVNQGHGIMLAYITDPEPCRVAATKV
jgi:hypothetical protein